ncbi:MAG: diguanylate cyclase [Treponema sp.]|nr:diguanylate cyclase [Treponema sp.]
MKYKIPLIAILVLAIVLFFVNQQESVYIRQIYDSAFDFKKGYLRDTTRNFINDIETTKNDSILVFNFTVDLCIEEMSSAVKNRRTAPQAIVRYFEGRADPSMWAAVLVDSKTQKLLGRYGSVIGDDWDGDMAQVYGGFCTSRTITDPSTSLTLVYGITTEHLEKTVQGIFTSRIHKYRFTDGAYIFMFKVNDYAGGENFAYRFAHPNQQLENHSVSTKGGVAGEHWYADMLAAIRETGEYFGEYDFADPDSGKSIPRLSYSCVYDSYDWIITMTTDRDLLTEYVNSTSAVNNVMLVRTLLPAGIVVIAVLILLLFLQMIRDRRKLQHEADVLIDRINWDELTHANTRQFGADELDHIFKNFKHGFASPALMLLDVDNFKGINDTYGHDAGDLVLKKIIETVYANCRASDKIIRWGGDEFVGIFDGMKLEYCTLFADKLLKAVSSIPFVLHGKQVSVTVSLGFAFFRNEDASYKDALNRADQALYQSKARGKNQGRVL